MTVDDYDPRFDQPRPDNPIARATRYTVTCLPEEIPDSEAWALTVEYRGHGAWVVKHGALCLSRDGEWGHEMRPTQSEHEWPAWVARHHFPLGEALELAKQAAPHATMGGTTAADVLAWHATGRPRPVLHVAKSPSNRSGRLMDAVGWSIATAHGLLGHDKAAFVLGVDPGDRSACLICAYEAEPTPKGKSAVETALSAGRAPTSDNDADTGRRGLPARERRSERMTALRATLAELRECAADNSSMGLLERETVELWQYITRLQDAVLAAEDRPEGWSATIADTAAEVRELEQP